MKNIKNVAFVFVILISFTAMAQNKKDPPVGRAGVKTESFKVAGNCEMCKKTIESALDTKGVKEAVWDLKTGVLTITYNEKKITAETIYKKLAASGYDSEKMRADDKAYNALPACCKYERKKW